MTSPARLARALCAASLAVTVALAVLVAPAQAEDTVVHGPRTIQQTAVIGHSAQGRAIRAWRLGQPGARRRALLFAGIHGDERGAVTTLRALRDGDPVVGVDLWVVPVVNPDGYAHDTRKNGRGVDLNRNFSTGWKRVTGPTDSGSKPFSEPETRALRDFVDRIDPAYVVAFHQPLDGVDVRGSRAPGWARKLASGLRLPTTALDCGSSCHGTFSMWFLRHHTGAALTVELRRRPSRTYLTKTAVDAVLRSFRARHVAAFESVTRPPRTR